jgi:TatD DNase family protein
MLVDTHCHIHEADYPLDRSEVIARAHAAGVAKMICVGTSEQSSRNAIDFAEKHEDIYATVGVHPHDTKDGYAEIAELAKQKVVAIGEVGLDYYYNHSPRDIQIAALESQIQTALDNNLPIIFHVRDAFNDFWPILDNFHGIRGELHSFTDTQANLDKGFERGLYVGVNGISTFTKDPHQQQLFAAIPLERLLLETDAPFLTPTPYRGTVNEPAFVSEVAKHHAAIRGISPEDVATVTTANATLLFDLK